MPALSKGILYTWKFEQAVELVHNALAACMYMIFWHVCLTASGALRCEINNGGCWKKTQDGRAYSACIVSILIEHCSRPRIWTQKSSHNSKRIVD